MYFSVSSAHEMIRAYCVSIDAWLERHRILDFETPPPEQVWQRSRPEFGSGYVNLIG